MAFVKVRVPRISQPQDSCGIDWGNPITQNLIVAVLAGCNLELVSGVPLTNYPSNGVGKNGMHLSQSALDATQMFLGRAVSIPAGSDITGFAVLNESVLRTNNNHGFWRSNNTSVPFFVLQANTGLPHIRVSSDVLKPTSGPAIDFTAPDNRIFFRLKSSAWADYGFDGKSVNYATHAQATPACNVTSIGTQFGAGNALGNAPLLLMFRRTLSDDEAKSLTDNPWQIFEPEELTIWVPDADASGPTSAVTGNVPTATTVSTGQFTVSPIVSAAITAAAAAATGAFSVSPLTFGTVTTEPISISGGFSEATIAAIISGTVSLADALSSGQLLTSPEFTGNTAAASIGISGSFTAPATLSGFLQLRSISLSGSFLSGDFTLTPAQLEELWNWYQVQKTKRYVTLTEFIALKDVL